MTIVLTIICLALLVLCWVLNKKVDALDTELNRLRMDLSEIRNIHDQLTVIKNLMLLINAKVENIWKHAGYCHDTSDEDEEE